MLSTTFLNDFKLSSDAKKMAEIAVRTDRKNEKVKKELSYAQQIYRLH